MKVVLGDRLVHRIVDDFREEMVERRLVGAADVLCPAGV